VAGWFARSGLAYPPQRVALVALKDEARLELWADGGAGWRFVRSYLVRCSSGRLGPKLHEGDHQVPEGVYGIAALNPDSRYHLSLRLDYPNAFDRARAREEGRLRLGGDIMIHGGEVSDGCLPVGDSGVEELFALVARVGSEHVLVIVSPVDLRRIDARVASGRATVRRPWLGTLYATLSSTLESFPLPSEERPLDVPRHVRPTRTQCKAYDVADCAHRCGVGDVGACARAGLMYADGRGVPVDRARAWELLGTACAGGDALGCAELGRLYLTDDGPRRDAARAAVLARVACDGGDGHGCATLAQLCLDRVVYPGTGEPCSDDLARRLWARAYATLRKDCGGWGGYDCDTLATLYADADPRTALRFASGSCRAGDPGGCAHLARLYEDGGDATRARNGYQRACAAGWASACERSVASK
jgi:TPR repeat protein